MAWPSDLVRTKNWSTEVLTDSDLEGQLDLIVNWVMAALNSTTGHAHEATANKSQKVSAATGLLIASQAQGDILYASSATAFARLAAGTAGQALTTAGAAANPAWAGMTTHGDVEYRDATTRQRLAAGTAGQFLRTAGAGAAPTWANPAEGELAAASVDQATLKTTTAETAFSTATHSQLTGGQYVFVPLLKRAAAGSNWITTGDVGGANHNVGDTFLTTSFTGPWAGSDPGSTTMTVQTRYVTTSGKDYWIFLLVAKIDFDEVMGNGFVRHHKAGDILVASAAPDHPCYGTGSLETERPHPFVAMDAAKHEVVLVSNEHVAAMRAKVNSKRAFTDVLLEEYQVDMASRPIFQPREIIEIDEHGDKPGEIIKRMKTPEFAKLIIPSDEIVLKRRMVTTLPPEIKYRSL